MPRTIDPELAQRFREMTTTELEQARDDLLVRLDEPDASTEDADEADAIATEIDARQRVTQRRAQLAQRLRNGHVEGRGQQAATPRGQADDSPGPGTQLTASDGWRSFAANGGRGRFSADIETRALLNTGTAQTVERTPFPQGAPGVPTLMLDILPNQPTQAGRIEWVGETAGSSASLGAGSLPVAEGTAKPEATLVFEPLAADVKTIAAWVQLTRQLYDDNQGLNGWLNARLTGAVRATLDVQVVGGDGTGANLLGLMSTPGVQSQATTAGDSLAVAARKAMTLIQNRGQTPTHIIANPTDAQNMALKTNTGGDLLDYSALGLPPIVPDPNMATTKFVVGSFTSDNIALRVRQAATVIMSDSHDDNFVKNILILLAELRAALCVWNPASFVKGTLS